jgi:glutamyl-tRNA synthetase
MAVTTRPVRVRYAPSPTGALHLGGARTALFNYLFARQKGGNFLLRIEDTDRARVQPGSEEQIKEALLWLGLQWDETPLIQSQRKDIYRAAAETLLETGAAYRCFCTPARLEAMRAEQRARKEPERYDRRCAALPAEEAKARADAGEPFVVRQRMPTEGTTTLHDLVMGTVVFKNQSLDDHVLLKSDGFPTYHLAFAVDDHGSEITHVIRGDGWLPSAPKHLLLIQSFGWDPPAFAHVPLVLGPDRKPLAKRHGAKDILEYRTAGYLPEAMVNFVAFLGWSPGTEEEIFNLQELVSKFSIEKIQPSPAIANLERLDWLNGQFIRRLSPDDLGGRIASRMPGVPVELIRPVVPLVQERLRTLAEAPEMLGFFFEAPMSYRAADLVPKGRDPSATIVALEAARKEVLGLSDWTAESIEKSLRSLADRLGWSSKELFMTLRVAITGRTVTPPLMESLRVLGREQVVSRLERAAAALVS